jgi:hypothetical protein
MSEPVNVQALIEGALDNFNSDLDPVLKTLIESNLNEVSESVAAFVHILDDGVQLSDFSNLGPVVAPLMRLAAEFENLDGSSKKAFVSEVVYMVYRIVDGWPDGKQNNINIPWLFGGMEKGIEKTVCYFAAGMAVEALYDGMSASGEV